ncbi:MAG: chloride channel protein [Beijerinckiaceae bacterium]|jgi:chloride channel protein, CIC family|nr:chloride channel protein [Beijerinckiaceae bacterium]MDO9442293.1 chloride channel protein [Beijerinckiaceae bacterium]
MAGLPSQAFERFFPYWLRTFVRARESGLVLAGLVIGVFSGVLVGIIAELAQWLHEVFYGLARYQRLSATPSLETWRALAVPVAGGLFLSTIVYFAGSRFKGRMADAIEANALHGGRLSFMGSLYITLQTFVSNAFGASVGLEAAYTQVCAAISSILGRGLAARRSDMRLLVACGAAGAISAAFGAPLAGAFYAFEVVLGAYAVASLVPVVASAIVASIVATMVSTHHGPLPAIPDFQVATGEFFGHVVMLGAVCAIGSILLMKGVALAERLFTTRFIPAFLRPALGGLIVGGFALITPQVLGAGHGAFQRNLTESIPLVMLAGIIILKALASAISLGSGFRGGLFFASMLLGGMIGRFYAEAVSLYTPFDFPASLAAIAGMAAFGTGVLGAPVTMTVLALETTGSFSVTVAALAASALAALIVRETFGYSFATWRFHLRGETIRGPHDVGWVRQLNVARLMRKDARTVPADVTIGVAREMFPPGTTKQIVALDQDGRYAGLILTADLHGTLPEQSQSPVAELAGQKNARLLPHLSVRETLDAFEKSETDVLVVIDDDVSRRVLGLVTESHALRRYGEELERRNREFAR